MSASRKKKERKLLEAEQASLNNAKKGKEKKTGTDRAFRDVLIVVAIIVLAAIIIISCVSCRNYNRKNATVAEVGDQKIPASMMNYAFFDSVNNFYSQYGSIASMVLDANTPLDKQACTMSSDAGTWADYFIEQAGETLEHYYNISAAAERDGYKLTDEDKETIDAVVASYKSAAKANGTSIDSYLSSLFGAGCDEDSFVDYITLQMTVDGYNRYFVETYEPTDDEAADAYAADPAKFDTVSCYMVTKSATSFVETAEDGSVPEVGDAEKAKAKEAAEEVKADFDTAELSASSYLKSTVSSYSEDAAEWLFDASRKAGDTELFASADESVYYVFNFVEKDDYDYNTVNCKYIVVSADEQAEDADAALEEAFATYSEIKEKLTAENFDEIAEEYGLAVNPCENYTKSGLDDQVISWLFGARKENDLKDFNVGTSYYFYLYEGEGENCNSIRVKNTILNEKWEDATHAGEIVFKEKNFKYIRTDMIPANYFSAN